MRSTTSSCNPTCQEHCTSLMLCCAQLCQCILSQPVTNPHSRSAASHRPTFAQRQQRGLDHTNLTECLVFFSFLFDLSKILLRWLQEPQYPKKHCYTSWQLDDMWLTWWCGWKNDEVDMIDVVDMLVWMLTMTVVCNSEVSQRTCLWFFSLMLLLFWSTTIYQNLLTLVTLVITTYQLWLPNYTLYPLPTPWGVFEVSAGWGTGAGSRFYSPTFMVIQWSLHWFMAEITRNPGF